MCGHGASSLHKDKMCDTSPVMSSDQIKCIIACVHAYLTDRLKAQLCRTMRLKNYKQSNFRQYCILDLS